MVRNVLTYIRLTAAMLSAFCLMTQSAAAVDNLTVLGYYDIPQAINGDMNAVDRSMLIQHIEFLRLHDYVFVDIDDVISAQSGEKKLPPKSILLTFNNAYYSFYEFVFPVLKLYNIPCVLSVVTSWIDNPPPYPHPQFMNWQQIDEVNGSGNVTVVSGTHNDVVTDNGSNRGADAASLSWNPDLMKYETENEYRERITSDLLLSRSVLKVKLGIEVNTLIWQDGQITMPALEEAATLGYVVSITGNVRGPDIGGMYLVDRHMITMNKSVNELRHVIEYDRDAPNNIRAVRVNLDNIYSLDKNRLEDNISSFIEYMKGLGVSTVYLEACADPDGDGIKNEAYFPNRILPVRDNILNRVVDELECVGIEVYASMPVLSIMLPGEDNTHLVHKREHDRIYLSHDDYRMSPFDDDSISQIAMIYEDLAKSTAITGVVFEEDGFLAKNEDFSTNALEEFKILESSNGKAGKLNGSSERELERAWTKVKTERLTAITNRYMLSVRKWRPAARFARIISWNVLLDSDEEKNYAQNYKECLGLYDEVIVEIDAGESKLKDIVDKSGEYERGVEKTVFFITVSDQCEDTESVGNKLRELIISGAYNIGYESVGSTWDKPVEEKLRMVISKDSFPGDGE